MSFYKYNRPKVDISINTTSSSSGGSGVEYPSVSIWGQPFNHTNNIDGDFITQGKVSIGNAESYFEWDEDNNALKFNGNLYATGNLTAFGYSGGGEGSDGSTPSSSTIEWSKIQNKPNFSQVAFSGSYNDLTDKPTIGNFDLSNYVKTDDYRLTNSRPASDVYSWAKASTKPSYTLDEISDGTTKKYHSHSNKSVLDSLTQTMIQILNRLSIDSSGNLVVSGNLCSTGNITAYK